MSELELVGLHEDGEHLVLMGSDGQRFRLRIDEPLRAAVRRDRPQLEQLRARRQGALAPREIQARIRAGHSAEAVAEAADIAVEHVRRYEGPVLAEREHVAQQGRATRVGRDTGAPVLGDLVTDRLAARGVTPGSIAWDAFREAGGPWTVAVRFHVADEPREALWSFDSLSRSVQALDDEARWLSETELADEVIPRRHLSAVRDVVFDVGPDGRLRPVSAIEEILSTADIAPEPEPDPREATAALLDDLSTKRGVRQPLSEDDPEEFEGFGPQHTFDFGGGTPDDEPPAAHPPLSEPESATDTQVLPRPAGRRPKAVPPRPATGATPTAPSPAPAPTTGATPAASTRTARTAPTPRAPEPAAATHAAPDADEPLPVTGSTPASGERSRGRRGRASVPSWDEIVFGAKPE